MLNLGRLRRQADRLDRYCAQLRHNPATPPPAGLDSDLARVARAIEQESELPTTSAAFRANLWSRIADQPSVSGVSRPWTGPAIDRNAGRRAHIRETEEQQIMTAPIEQQPSKVGHWSNEIWKIAAAIAIFALAGALLILLLRDDNEPSVAGPGSPTTSSSPSAGATATIEPTRAAAIAGLTATAGAVTDQIATKQAALPVAGEIIAEIAVESDLGDMAASDDAVWVSQSGAGSVVRIDPQTNTIVATVAIGQPGGSGPEGSPSEISVYEDQVWVLSNADGMLVRIDPATSTVAKSFAVELADVSAPASSMVVDEHGLWVTDTEAGTLVNIDPQTGAVLATIDIPNANGVAAGFGSIWVMAGKDYGPYRIVRVDPATYDVVAEIPVDTYEGISVATGAGYVWVSDWGKTDITRIDPATNTVVGPLRNPLGGSHAVVATEHGVWVSSIFEDGVARIDPATNEGSRILGPEYSGSVGMVEAAGSIWVSFGGSGVVLRIDPAAWE